MIAGVEDVPVEVAALSDREKVERWKSIAAVVTAVARAKMARLQREEFEHLVAKLTAKPYSIAQIQAGAEQLERMDTAHTRPLAWENWERAFSEPVFTAQQLAGRVREAYEKGRRSRDEESSSAGMSDDTKDLVKKLRRLLETERRCDELAAELRKSSELIAQQREGIIQRDRRILELEEELEQLRQGRSEQRNTKAA